jgi:hypothetical protein
MVSSVVLSASENELAYIAALDHGKDLPRHLDALKTVLFKQQGHFREGQVWFPYEVVELGSHALVPGHEREFAICTLLVVEAVLSGFDSGTDLSDKLSNRATDYDLLPKALRDEVLSAYTRAEC